VRNAVIFPLGRDEGGHGYRPIASWTQRVTLPLSTSPQLPLRAVLAQPDQLCLFVLPQRAIAALMAPPTLFEILITLPAGL
jgi:hypothetical protein